MRRNAGYFIDMFNIHRGNNIFQLLFGACVIPGECLANDIIIIIKQDTGFSHTGNRHCTDLLSIIQIFRYRFETMKYPVPDEVNIKISIFSVLNFGRFKTILIN